MTHKKLVVLITLFCCNCGAWRKPLNLTRMDYNGNDIKLNGFYCNKSFLGFFLYRNGIILGAQARAESLESFISYWEWQMADGSYKNNYPPEWGVYRITPPEITIEKWMGGDAGARYRTATYKGKILNDTTIVLPVSYFLGDTFYFHPMHSKPDSTNRFIK